jgi:uncharacterized peroxidase-related enzyme
MAFIDTPDDEGTAADLYAADRERQGYVTNYTRVFANRPRVYTAWQELSAAIRASMDQRRYELATLAAARQLRSSYCSLAHGKVLAEQFYDPETVQALALDHSAAPLAPAEVAVMELAEKVARDATTVTAGDIDRLRGLGLTDGEIMDVVLTAAARCFFSKTLDALGAEPDSAYWNLDPGLRDALTVGRPIAARQDTPAD